MKFSCPFPDNLNPLSPNGFQLIIDKLPGVTFFCQNVPIPGISMPEAIQGSPFTNISLPGETIEFEPLTVSFLVDEKMENWKSVFKWMNGLGFPIDNEQYNEYRNESKMNLSELQEFYSDGRLIIYDNNLSPIQTINFVNLHPTSLGQLDFTNTSTDVEYLTATATFNYTLYKFD